MTKSKVLGFLFVVCSLFTIGAAETFACLCYPQTPKQRVRDMKENADAIFVGSVQSIAFEGETSKVVLKIAKSWKGRDVETLTIYMSRYSDCRVSFEDGVSYLVYAKGDENNLLTTNICFGSGVIEIREKDFKHLGKPLFERKERKK